MLGGDVLYVSDTNHHRLSAISADPDRFGEDLGGFSTRTPLARFGRVYPIAHRYLPDGSWWVVVGDGRLQYADIIVFDEAGHPRRRLDLPEGASPVGLEIVGDRVRAPDPVNLRVAALTFDGEVAGDFGDEAFRAELGRMRGLKRMYKALRYASWAALGVLLLALAAIRLGALPRASRAQWVWLLVAALLGLLFLGVIGLGILWLAGALYEDIIVLMVGLCATVITVPTLLTGVVMAWRTVSSRQSGAGRFRRRASGRRADLGADLTCATRH